MKLLRWRTCCLVRVTPTQLVLLQARTISNPLSAHKIELCWNKWMAMQGASHSRSLQHPFAIVLQPRHYIEYISVISWYHSESCCLVIHTAYSHTMFNHIPWEDKMLKVEKNNENRSLKTNRLFPTANKPDPMPQNLAFLFTKITPEQMIYMWNVLTAIFVTQVLMVIGYCTALATFPEYWWTCTLLFGIPFSYIAIQQMLVLSCFLFLGTSWRMVLDV